MIDALERPILFVGAGKMGGAILAGLLEDGLDPQMVVVLDPCPPEETKDLVAKYGITHIKFPDENLVPQVVVLGVKPQMFEVALSDIEYLKFSKETLFVSIIAGKALHTLFRHMGSVPIIRAMPNTPAAIARSMTVCVANKYVNEQYKKIANDLLLSIGQVIWIEDEDKMDAVTALSGSGPAYVFWLTECMVQAGIKAGLDEAMALELAKGTVSGAGELMRFSEDSPSTLRENVTSPGGTTEAALKVLMSSDGGLDGLMKKAIQSAASRSKTLSR